MYIEIHGDSVLLYQNPSVWLDTLDASNWDRKPPNLTIDMVCNHSAISVTYVRSDFITHMH